MRIAKRLNAEGIRGPRGRSWAPTAIREMLRRELYAGRVVWNKTRWADRGGTKVKAHRPASEWITVEAPALRIVPPEIWAAARARLEQSRRTYLRWTGGKLWGRPESGLVSRYLLTGFSQCGLCGGSLSVWARSPDKGPLTYRCIYHAARGPAVCPNRLTLPLPLAHAEIVGRLRQDVLTPERIERAITQELDAYAAEAASVPASAAALRRDLARLDEECARLAGAIATGAALPALLAALAERERSRAARRAELAALEGLARATEGLDRGGLRAEIRGWLAEWHALLNEEPQQARQLLRKLFVSRLVWTPRRTADGAFYDYRVDTAYGRLLAGVVGVKSGVPPG